MDDSKRVRFGIAGLAKLRQCRPLRYLHSSVQSLVRIGCPRKSKKTQRDLSRPGEQSWIHHIGLRSENRFFWRQAVPGSSLPAMFGWAQPSASPRRLEKGRSRSCSYTNIWHLCEERQGGNKRWQKLAGISTKYGMSRQVPIAAKHAGNSEITGFISTYA